ncbi:tetratricopeptide repeat-containing glycosyltransferase family 2 protein [Chengkuizengella axinellae]|uniref:Glycosyltransferase n=1 Tax=Chengkuizengella axinellae TaxID=3064388 RepID=A0ABT9J6K6_9BACL|nr:glycosyltransferase [Chengkuizengella sp. 2205SS18-9]MDP5277188.1 glycosyltransferase [Chengkuizengella sp. 2205SS18-9]
MSSATISLCMIVKNEEEVLERCLETVTSFTDEIIIVDTGSTDRTKEIASKYTTKIFDFEWIDDFSKARNFSFSKATKDYIMWLDADDIVPKESSIHINELKKNYLSDHKMDCVMMDYQTVFDAEGNLITTLRRERLVKRKCNFQWIGIVHETLNVSGKAYITDIKIKHMKNKPYSNQYIKIYEKAIKQGHQFSLSDKFQYAYECFQHKQYEKAMKLYDALTFEKLDIKNGKIYAYLKLAECYIKCNELDKAISSCLHTFALDPPKAEVCCRLGHIYELKKQFHQAIGWYKIAFNIDIPVDSAYVKMPCYTWLPHIRLCICYMVLRNVSEARKHNEIAAQYIPNSTHVIDNERLLQKLDSKLENNN